MQSKLSKVRDEWTTTRGKTLAYRTDTTSSAFSMCIPVETDSCNEINTVLRCGPPESCKLEHQFSGQAVQLHGLPHPELKKLSKLEN